MLCYSVSVFSFRFCERSLKKSALRKFCRYFVKSPETTPCLKTRLNGRNLKSFILETGRWAGKNKWHALGGTVMFQCVAMGYVNFDKTSQNACDTYLSESSVNTRTSVGLVKIVLRTLQLYVTFIPIFLLSPLLYCGETCRTLWFKIFLFGVELSGPVIIKLGQWASTRRDLFSEEFCKHMSKLQRRTRPHSWHHTETLLKEAYGPSWNQTFVNIDMTPVGSGCCAQVYKAWIKAAPAGEISLEQGNSEDDLLPVAVKVVHPKMDDLLRRDLAVLNMAAVTVNWILPSIKWLSLEECVKDFTKSMEAQVNMSVEAKNIDRFTKNFAGTKTVKFPQPVWHLTNRKILVETFENGVPLINYITETQEKKINSLLADIGINAILKMVFDDNFVHGDMHPGNMLVQPVENDKPRGFLFQFSRKLNAVPLRLVILDCGIVASLDEKGKKGLRDVFTAVVNGDGRKVAELFLAHSKHECTNVDNFKEAMHNIVCEALGKRVTLEKIQVSSLMTTLFSTMINHKVKLDGSFSSVILAIMVLEGLGRSLDSTMDIVEKAKPFLLNAM